MQNIRSFFLCFFIFFFFSPLFAFAMQYSVSWEEYRIENTNDFVIQVKLSLPQNVYIYAAEEHSGGLPTSIIGSIRYTNAKQEALSFIAPLAVAQSTTRHPVLNVGDDPLIYPDSPSFLLPISPKENDFTVQFTISGLLCSERNCQPFEKTISIPSLTKANIALLPVAAQSIMESLHANLPLPQPVSPVKEEDTVGKSSQGSIHSTSFSALSEELTTNSMTNKFVTEGTSLESFISGNATAKKNIPKKIAIPTESEIDIDDASREGASTYVFSFLDPHYYNPRLEVTALSNAILLGLVAGLLLNLMPCVLPVISLKFTALMAVSSMIDKEAQARAFRMHCLVFALGVIVWFIALAFLLGLAGLAWGELFQSPIVVSILGFILFLLGLSLFGVYSLPIFDLRVTNSAHPHWQAFASGLLATLLATPCSGPLLGGVLGWALRQDLLALVLTIVSVGFGMALPYFAMAMYPRLVHLLPKPGSWTIRLEQLLGFFLMGSVVYLITLLPSSWVVPFILNLVAFAFAAWLWGQIGHLGASTKIRCIARFFAILTIVFAILIVRAGFVNTRDWENFEPDVFLNLLGEEPLLVQFTADWCPSCKALEHTTLKNDRMERLRLQYGMRTLRVDLTRNNEEGKKLLEALGSSSIPVLALFPKGEQSSKPLVMRDIVTPAQLSDALEKTFIQH